jgi:hypothetical protein
MGRGCGNPEAIAALRQEELLRAVVLQLDATRLVAGGPVPDHCLNLGLRHFALKQIHEATL